MPWSAAEFHLLLPLFMLVLSRVSGLMIASPMFSSAAMPMQFKVFLAVAMSIAVFPFASQFPAAEVTLASAVIGLVGEFMLGLLIGFGITLLFVGVQLAGQLISQQAGIALGAVFNPELDSSVTPVSQIYFFVSLMIFLALGGEQALVSALLDSFRTIPLLTFRMTEHVFEMVVDLLGLSFVWAIRVGAPTTVALLLSFLTLGFVSRSVPQLNILTIGFPIKAAIGILVMALSIVSLEGVLIDSLTSCMEMIRETLALPPTP